LSASLERLFRRDRCSCSSQTSVCATRRLERQTISSLWLIERSTRQMESVARRRLALHVRKGDLVGDYRLLLLRVSYSASA
jgi:hypothetical protein